MISFFRLLELSGCQLLVEDLSPQQATNIFKYYGASVSDLSDEESLKRARKRLMMQNHPDKAGADGLEAAKEINSAYDVLRSTPRRTYSDQRTPPPEWTNPRQKSAVPEWQTDKNSTNNNIRRNDYLDLNYVKKNLWELSRKSKTQYAVWNYDGNFFREKFVVYGSPDIFSDIAEAMRVFDSYHKSRAVFVSNGQELLLIWSDGEDRDPPISFDNVDPGTDQQFVRNLPRILNKIKLTNESFIKEGQENVLRIGSKTIPVTAAPDDVYEVIESNFEFGIVGEAKLVPITELNGGVHLNDKSERKRVNQLKAAMMGIEGYCARLIVDQNGNVIEGQHRLSALQELGSKMAPVQIIIDLAANIDVLALETVIQKAQPMHSDHLHQIISQILRLVHDEGSAETVKNEYCPPRGFDAGWNAGLDALI